MIVDILRGMISLARIRKELITSYSFSLRELAVEGQKSLQTNRSLMSAKSFIVLGLE